MPLGQQIAGHLPYLRRYARALTGSQQAGDAAVKATLQVALGDEAIKASLSGGRIALYRLFLQVFAQGSNGAAASATGANDRETRAQTRLGAVTPQSRQALLLTTVEEFSTTDAALIMDLSVAETEALIAAAIEEIESEQSASVLIIEDEPMILLQLEDLVTSQGHKVCGTATTHKEAIAAANASRPGLVLADIQLADGSSGIDAVTEILTKIDVPVIFITGYPERLLTGEGDEPTYLITKPFREQTVKAAISQALFFASPAEQTAAQA